jgi:hypothetical protein
MHRILGLTLSLVALAATAIEPPQSPPGAPRAPAPAGQEQEPAPAPEAGPPPDAPAPAPADAQEAEKQEAEEEELPPLPAGTEPAGPPPQRFNPTEKVRADFPVSFPIDI